MNGMHASWWWQMMMLITYIEKHWTMNGELTSIYLTSYPSASENVFNALLIGLICLVLVIFFFFSKDVMSWRINHGWDWMKLSKFDSFVSIFIFSNIFCIIKKKKKKIRTMPQNGVIYNFHRWISFDFDQWTKFILRHVSTLKKMMTLLICDFQKSFSIFISTTLLITSETLHGRKTMKRFHLID